MGRKGLYNARKGGNGREGGGKKWVRCGTGRLEGGDEGACGDIRSRESQ